MSTIKVNSIKNTSTDDGGIAIDNTGHVQIDGQQLPTAGPLSNRNLIINGAMQVAQRGTTGTANGYNCADRFGRDVNLGTGTFTDTVHSLGPSQSPYDDDGFRKFFRVSSSSASTAGNTSYLQVRYKAEAQDIATSGWKYTDTSSYITLSFWVRASVAQTYGFSVQSHDGTDYVYNKTFTLSANTWTKVTQSIPGRSGLQFNNDNGIGLIIKWFPHLGSTYNGATDNTWDSVANANYGASLGTSWWTASSATFDLTGVQLEVGEKATPFEHRSFGDELARCQRYFQTSFTDSPGTGNTSNAGIVLAGGGATGNTTSFVGAAHIQLAPSMRATPTVTVFDLATPRNTGKVHRHTYGVAGSNNNTAVVTDTNTKSFVVRSDSGSSANGLIFHYQVEAEL